MIRENGKDFNYFDTFVGKTRTDFVAKKLKERGYEIVIERLPREKDVYIMYTNPAITVYEGKSVSPSSLILTRKYLSQAEQK